MKAFRIVLCLLTLNGLIFGAGFALFEHSAEATGMAGAFAATASDPGALFYNPAGIGFQEGSVYVETTAIILISKFYGSGAYPGTGVREKMVAQTFWPSNVSLVQPLGKKLTFGFGIFNPFGLGTKWEHPTRYSGRFLSTMAEIQGYNAIAALAYRPVENLSVSLGVHYLAAGLSLEKYIGKINPYTQSEANIGFVRMEADLSGEFGYDFGLLYKLGATRLGLTYHSGVDIDFDGTATMSQVYTGYADFDAMVGAQFPAGDHPVATSISFPAMAFAGIAHQVNDNLRFEFNLGWTDWSVYDKLDVRFKDIPSLSSSHRTDWKDTYTYRFGMEYRFKPSAALRAGVLYDETPQPQWEMSPLLADADRVGFCLGYGTSIKKISLDAGYMYLIFKQRATHGTQQDGYEGEYRNKAHLLGVAMTYHF